MKKVNIFLTTSENMLRQDITEISNFIRDLNDKLEDYNVYFRLITDDNTENINEDDIKNSEIFLIIFSNEVREKVVKEFNIAYKKFKLDKTPKISTYIKKSNEKMNDSMINFMKLLEEELGYYCLYDNIDTIKLNIILSLNALGLELAEIQSKDGKLYIGKNEIMSLDKLPMIFNNKNLSELKKQIAEIEDTYWLLKEKRDNSDEDFEKYTEISQKRKLIENEIFKIEKNIIDLQKNFIETVLDGGVSQRQLYAKKFLDNGDIEKAVYFLDFDEIKEDGEQLLKLDSKQNVNLEVLLNELIERIEILEKDRVNFSQKELNKTYEEAIRIERLLGKTSEITWKHAISLRNQGRYLEAAILVEQYCYYLKMNNERIDKKIYEFLVACFEAIEMDFKVDEYKKYL